MYEAYWGLSEPPFALTPDPRFLYLSKEHEDALMMLHYTLTRNRGAGLLAGDIGLGKTTLSRKLLELLDPVAFKVALIVNPVLTPTQLMREILSQLGSPVNSRDRQELVQKLYAKLIEMYEHGQRAVLIIDEAHLIRGSNTFEELRLLLNCQMNDQFLLSLLLLGQLELLKKVEKVPALHQRMAVKHTIKPLDQNATTDLIEFRLRTAGYAGDRVPFTPDALFEMHQFTGGYPRLVCQVADNALMIGMSSGAKHIDGFTMHGVISDFQGKEW
ncbi:MAG: AAA family ATPase [Armatimonadetes bacterium]|nr:AAA family ATPase [Armatimonadota bacterium]